MGDDTYSPPSSKRIKLEVDAASHVFTGNVKCGKKNCEKTPTMKMAKEEEKGLDAGGSSSRMFSRPIPEGVFDANKLFSEDYDTSEDDEVETKLEIIFKQMCNTVKSENFNVIFDAMKIIKQKQLNPVDALCFVFEKLHIPQKRMMDAARLKIQEYLKADGNAFAAIQGQIKRIVAGNVALDNVYMTNLFWTHVREAIQPKIDAKK